FPVKFAPLVVKAPVGEVAGFIDALNIVDGDVAVDIDLVGEDLPVDSRVAAVLHISVLSSTGIFVVGIDDPINGLIARQVNPGGGGDIDIAHLGRIRGGRDGSAPSPEPCCAAPSAGADPEVDRAVGVIDRDLSAAGQVNIGHIVVARPHQGDIVGDR